jgi:predicted DNA-binding transcriptional regulator AlpA
MQDTMPVLISRRTAAKISGMSISWVRNQERNGTGPPRLRLGAGPGRIRFDLDRFMEWLKQYQEPARRADGGTANHA